MRDLSKIAPRDTAGLELLMPGSSEKLGLTLKIISPEDERIKQEVRRIRDKHRFLQQRGRPVTTKDEEKIAFEIAMVAVVDWEWTAEDACWNGAQPAFNRADLEDMISRDWLRTQVDAFLADDRNFFPV